MRELLKFEQLSQQRPQTRRLRPVVSMAPLVRSAADWQTTACGELRDFRDLSDISGSITQGVTMMGTLDGRHQLLCGVEPIME